jgi:hypothetical protein
LHGDAATHAASTVGRKSDALSAGTFVLHRKDIEVVTGGEARLVMNALIFGLAAAISGTLVEVVAAAIEMDTDEEDAMVGRAEEAVVAVAVVEALCRCRERAEQHSYGSQRNRQAAPRGTSRHGRSVAQGAALG